MKAVDTNILARLIIQDDSAQLGRARAFISQGVWVPTTVLLELGWLLKSRYRFSRNALANALTTLLAHPRIEFGDEEALGRAMALVRGGADFADVIHLIAARGSEAFGTFDREVPDEEAFGVPVEYLG